MPILNSLWNLLAKYCKYILIHVKDIRKLFFPDTVYMVEIAGRLISFFSKKSQSYRRASPQPQTQSLAQAYYRTVTIWQFQQWLNICRHYSGADLRWAGGNWPPNHGLAPKMWLETLTNSKHRHTGAKRSVLWLSKYMQMLPMLLRPPSRLRRAHSSSYPTPLNAFSASILPPLELATLAPPFGGGIPRPIFLCTTTPQGRS